MAWPTLGNSSTGTSCEESECVCRCYEGLPYQTLTGTQPLGNVTHASGVPHPICLDLKDDLCAWIFPIECREPLHPQVLCDYHPHPKTEFLLLENPGPDDQST